MFKYIHTFIHYNTRIHFLFYGYYEDVLYHAHGDILILVAHKAANGPSRSCTAKSHNVGVCTRFGGFQSGRSNHACNDAISAMSNPHNINCGRPIIWMTMGILLDINTESFLLQPHITIYFNTNHTMSGIENNQSDSKTDAGILPRLLGGLLLSSSRGENGTRHDLVL